MILTFIAVGAFVATLLGGLFALKFKDKLHLVLGFSAGAIIGVAFFDLLPEALELTEGVFEVSTVTALIALGFVLFMLIDRFVSPHTHHGEEEGEESCHNDQHAPKVGGRFGAGSLSLHSFIDGVAIAVAFQISVPVGLIVAIAVLVHDFSDGINTVSLVLKGGRSKKEAFRWLLVDASMPVIGIIVGSFIALPAAALGVILALFTGFFVYMGASDLLPESHHTHPTYWTTFTTIVGIAVIYGAITIAGI